MAEALGTDSRRADRSAVPWFIRLVQASPLTPVWTAVCIGAGLTLANFAVSGLSAGALPIDAYFVSQALGHSLMLAYVFWASHFLWSGALRDLGDLGSVLRGGAETQDARVRRLSYLRPGVIALSALAAFAFSQASIEFYTGRVGRLLAGGTLAPMDAFLLVNNFLVWLVSGPALYIGFVLALRFGRIGERHVVVNLLDLRPLAPFARFGLRMAFVILAALALFIATLAIGPSKSRALPNAAIVIFPSSPIVALAVLALVAPSLGIRRQIRVAKRAELQRVYDALAGDRGALADSPLGREGLDLSVVELVTWRNAVAQIREWPFDAAALGRLGLYLLIPVASWVGGALVERVVNAILD